MIKNKLYILIAVLYFNIIISPVVATAEHRLPNVPGLEPLGYNVVQPIILISSTHHDTGQPFDCRFWNTIRIFEYKYYLSCRVCLLGAE